MHKIDDLLFPYARSNIARIRSTSGRFVHYTSAYAATEIIKKERVWMRQARCMNDFMEIDYGINCLRAALHSENGKALINLLDQTHNRVATESLKKLDQWLPFIRTNSYLTCVSEHDPSEDDHGRLSMWRACGGKASVALVLNNEAFMAESDALRAWTSPVKYASEDEIVADVGGIFVSMKDNIEIVQSASRDYIENSIFNFLLFGILSIKHPGFLEEKEWRVVHCPDMHPSDVLEQEMEVVNGVPQMVMKIPLKDIPEENFVGASLVRLLGRVIIGPTEYPSAVRRAFVKLLEGKGIENADEIVINSGIPLR